MMTKLLGSGQIASLVSFHVITTNLLLFAVYLKIVWVLLVFVSIAILKRNFVLFENQINFRWRLSLAAKNISSRDPPIYKMITTSISINLYFLHLLMFFVVLSKIRTCYFKVIGWLLLHCLLIHKAYQYCLNSHKVVTLFSSLFVSRFFQKYTAKLFQQRTQSAILCKNLNSHILVSIMPLTVSLALAFVRTLMTVQGVWRVIGDLSYVYCSNGLLWHPSSLGLFVVGMI